MAKTATVLIPTHEHSELLAFAVSSSQEQSVEDVEIFIVGDGVDDRTRDVARDLTASDNRVRFFDCPKGLRHGEANRHEALGAASGRIVCYLADDDLWMPEHLAVMGELLSEADFAHTLPVICDGEGELNSLRVDLSLPYYRDLLLSGENRIPFSLAGHSLEAYLHLPHGWVPAPATTYTDLYFWNQFLAEGTLRVVSGFRPTALHFPTPQRVEWTQEQRIDELERWRAHIREPRCEAWMADELLEQCHADLAQSESDLNDYRQNQSRLEAHVAALETNRLGGSGKPIDPDPLPATQQIERLHRRVQILESLNTQLQTRLDSVLGAGDPRS